MLPIKEKVYLCTGIVTVCSAVGAHLLDRGAFLIVKINIQLFFRGTAGISEYNRAKTVQDCCKKPSFPPN